MSRFLRRSEATNGSTTPDHLTANASSIKTSSSARPSTEVATHSQSQSSSSNGTGSGTKQHQKTSHPLLRPHPDVHIPVQEPLTDQQQTLVASLRRHMEGLIQSHYYFSDGQPRKEGDHDEAGELVEPYYEKWERRWLDSEGDDTTLKRYMRAGKGNEQDAIKRLESTLHWRRSFKPDIIPPEDIRIEGETGKHILCGFDNDGRPILYLIPRHENTKSSDRQIRYVVWGLERTLDILPPGQTKVTLAIDFFNSTQATNPNMATSRKVLSILQNHYVERLGSALCIRPPWWMNAFYTAIQPFVDPVTKQKVKWNTDLKEFVPPSHLLKEYGGEYDFEFDKEITWSDILDFTGVAPDGTRLHESFAKMTEDEERRIRSGESLPATAASAKKQQDQRTQPIANGHTVNDDLQDDDDDEDDEDDEKPQFHDAQETISRSSAITVTQ